jgi:hypothetical protein
MLLDIYWGYNNVCIHEGNKWKAAFCTNRGLFKPLVMYFGLTNSPATFQTMMNKIFQDLITEGIISIYLDNILIFTNTSEGIPPDYSPGARPHAQAQALPSAREMRI